jgi:hypothetical protein
MLMTYGIQEHSPQIRQGRTRDFHPILPCLNFQFQRMHGEFISYDAPDLSDDFHYTDIYILLRNTFVAAAANNQMTDKSRNSEICPLPIFLK